MKLTAAYAVIALLTFGYAASSPDICKPSIFRPASECRFMTGLSSGMAWPMYWVWTAFEQGRAALQEGKE